MGRRHFLAFACIAVALCPLTAAAEETIKIGFPMPLSGPTAVYGVPITKGAEMAVADINAKGGVLGRKLELLTRDSKANADEAVRLARELIIKNNVEFLSGTLTSAEAPAVSTIAKENKIVFVAPTAKTMLLTAPQNLHPYIFRIASNTLIEGRTGAAILAKWQDVKKVATIAPDYAYGRDAVAAFIEYIKKLRPDIEIVDQQWPKLGEPDFTAFITAQMGKKPDAVFCDVFGGDFVSFTKQATPLGYFKAIQSRLVDGGEVGTVDEAQALGADYPYGIWSDAYDPVVWGDGESEEHKAYVQHLKTAMKADYGSGWAIVTLLFSKFEGRLEVVHEEPRRIVETAQFGGGLQAFEPPIADDSPDDGAVLLFDPSLIVLTVGPRTREFDPVRRAIVLDRRVHENAIVVGIEPTNVNGQPRPHLR
jgi:branched-chain amino acid transport system substrate-binding protein